MREAPVRRLGSMVGTALPVQLRRAMRATAVHFVYPVDLAPSKQLVRATTGVVIAQLEPLLLALPMSRVPNAMRILLRLTLDCHSASCVARVSCLMTTALFVQSVHPGTLARRVNFVVQGL